MNILFYVDGDDGSLLQAFRQQLPAHTLYDWNKDTDIPLDTIQLAIAWMPPDEFFCGLTRLTHVFAVAAGVDQLLTHPTLPESASVVRLQDAGMARQMAEFALYGVLHAQRKMIDFRQAQGAQQWAHHINAIPAEHTHVGILGAGALGARVANTMALNGYPVCCWSRTARTLDNGVASVHGEQALSRFLSQCTVLVCLLPLTDNTRGILNASLFDQLPRGAFLINPGRGEHLREDDLCAALDSGQLAGALLDVFSIEPLPAEHPFWQHPRITLTPHVAAKSLHSESVQQIVAGIAAVERGDLPDGLVERQRGY